MSTSGLFYSSPRLSLMPRRRNGICAPHRRFVLGRTDRRLAADFNIRPTTMVPADKSTSTPITINAVFIRSFSFFFVDADPLELERGRQVKSAKEPRRSGVKSKYEIVQGGGRSWTMRTTKLIRRVSAAVCSLSHKQAAPRSPTRGNRELPRDRLLLRLGTEPPKTHTHSRSAGCYSETRGTSALEKLLQLIVCAPLPARIEAMQIRDHWRRLTSFASMSGDPALAAFLFHPVN